MFYVGERDGRAGQERCECQNRRDFCELGRLPAERTRATGSADAEPAFRTGHPLTYSKYNKEEREVENV